MHQIKTKKIIKEKIKKDKKLKHTPHEFINFDEDKNGKEMQNI